MSHKHMCDVQACVVLDFEHNTSLHTDCRPPLVEWERYFFRQPPFSVILKFGTFQAIYYERLSLSIVARSTPFSRQGRFPWE